jgi:hypothetical protein
MKSEDWLRTSRILTENRRCSYVGKRTECALAVVSGLDGYQLCQGRLCDIENKVAAAIAPATANKLRKAAEISLQNKR